MVKTERILEAFVLGSSFVVAGAGAFATAYSHEMDYVMYGGGAAAAMNLAYICGRDGVRAIRRNKRRISDRAFQVMRELEGDYVDGER